MSDDTPRATDVLANERTFLAYVRTSLSLIAFGFVIARFALFTREIAGVSHAHVASTSTSGPFGVAVAISGVVVAIFGGYRYVAADRAIRENRSAALGVSQALVATGLVAAIGVAVAVILSIVR